MKFQTLALIIFLSLGINNLKVFSQTKLSECVFKPEDKEIVEQKLQFFSSKSDLPIQELIVEIGLSFLNTKYVAATLENGLEEKMIINLRELDCTTFVENCLALARMAKLGKTDFDSYVTELVKIRYRNGVRNQYPSRLHYFSEWIRNNSEKKIVSDTPNFQGIKLSKTINYMSTHPQDYPVLKEHPELIPVIDLQEKEISASGYYYFPKNNPDNLLKNLQHGDIIALTSTIDGVDINHVGIIIRKNNEFHLLHAPLSGGKVLVSDGPVTDFILPKSKNSGIMIARPIF